MDCYDCLPRAAERHAVAVCRRCGAGLCVDHVRLSPETVHQVAGTGTASSEKRARRITCGVCHEAEHSPNL
ncbi:DUF2180 family protein [Streptomyces sp. NPDC048172]|uniref:DUF2180 family protein n=1 Tax=Streptomyces sp. NPDC048172 TaxID=3365505 RepID=UPI0037180C18